MRTEREEAAISVVRDAEPFEILRARYVRQQFAPHMHETFAVGVIEAGRCRMRWRGEEVRLRAGQLVVLEPGEVHTGGPDGDEGWRYRMLYLPTSIVADAAGARGAAPVPRFEASVVDDAALALRVLSLHRELEAGESPLLGQVMLREVVSQLVRRHAVRRERPESDDAPAAARRVRDYLREHLAEPVSLCQLAEVVQLSAYHLIRVFRRAYGLPPYMYLEQLRIERARALLRAGVPTSHVAYETGFSDQSHLTRRFKRVVGVPPGQYAKSHGGLLQVAAAGVRKVA